MDTLLNPNAIMGNNNPPDALLAEANERIDAANKWLVERPEITDEEIADKAGGFKAQIAATRKALDDRRLTEKRAFLADQDAVYNTPLDLLQRAFDAIDGKIRAFLKAKDARIAEEKRKQEAEAERLRQEAADAARRAEEEAKKKGGDVLRSQAAAEALVKQAEEAATLAARPIARAAVKGTYTQRAITLRTYWDAKITDETKALKSYAKHPAIRLAALEAIKRVAKAEAIETKDATKAPAGVEFFSEER